LCWPFRASPSGCSKFLRPKGSAIHRAPGYAFVYAMLIADGAAMLIFQFTGRFNILHIGSGLHHRRDGSGVAQSKAVKLEEPALLLDVLVLCGIAGSDSR
jgi:uncharacterized membrane protein